MEQSAGNKDLRRALVSLVAPQADAAMLVAEFNQIIQKAWGRTRTSKKPWKLARLIAADLEPVLTALEQLVERRQAVAAENVLRRFVEAADKGFDCVDDSYGCLGPLCQEAVTLWGKAWAKIELRDPAALAKLVYDGVRDNGYAIRDHIIRDFAEALGREGLLALKDLLIAEHQTNLTRKGMDEWERRQPLRYLADVADALRDVDMYIDAQRQCGAEDTGRDCLTGIAYVVFDSSRPPSRTLSGQTVRTENTVTGRSSDASIYRRITTLSSWRRLTRMETRRHGSISRYRCSMRWTGLKQASRLFHARHQTGIDLSSR